MKKIIFALLVAMVLFTSCGNKLKAGTYEEQIAGVESTVTVKVTVDNDGKITSVFFDETNKDSTKKALGYNYGMKAYAGAAYEWFEQVEALEKAIVENQGTDFITLDENGMDVKIKSEEGSFKYRVAGAIVKNNKVIAKAK